MYGNEILALVLSLIAGLSTCIGSIAIFFQKRFSTKVLAFSLGFSAGVMIYVAIGDLMIESRNLIKQSMSGRIGEISVLLYLAAGMLFAAWIESFIPSESNLLINKRLSAQLFRVGIVSTFAVVLHNFPEGIATFMAGCQGISVGLPITFAVALHNIPEGLTIAMPIYFATKSRKKAFIYCVMAGLAEPFGALAAYMFLKPYLTTYLLGAIFAIVAGIMLFISFKELLPASRQHGHDYESLCGVLMGLLMFGFCLIIL